MTILQVLNNCVSVSKSFTQNFQDEVKKCIQDYKCESDDNKKDTGIIDRHLKNKRYLFPIPYIYSTHESFLSSFFEKPPELVIQGKGADDEQKGMILKSVYAYLVDKLDLEEFLHKAAWWFLLVGMVSSYQEYKMEIERYEPMMDKDGNPMMDESGEPITTPIYRYHDPVACIDDPMKVFFAPDSEYSINGENIPFIIREKLIEKEKLVEIYGDVAKEIKETAEVEVSGFKSDRDEDKSILKRVKTYYYCGRLPQEVAEQVENWKYDREYYAVFTTEKLLHVEEKERNFAMARWFAPPTDFFGYGVGKTLRSVQKEMSIRRGQQVRYADLYAYPWLLVDAQTTVDNVNIMDVQKRKPLVYNGQKPEYLVPPPMPQTIVDADNISRSDAQFISGTLDMSKGAQQTNTVKTATGQQIFAQSQEKRVQKARKVIGKFYREVVINLFKLCRDNWDEEKLISITDDNEEVQQLTVSGNDLEGIDFDTDLDISLDTLSVNKEALSERVIALYDKVKDDPMIDRRKIFAKMLREGFNIKNPESYMLQEEEQGSQPMGNDEQGMGEGMQDMESPQEDAQEPQEEPEEQELNNPETEALMGNSMAPRPNTYG